MKWKKDVDKKRPQNQDADDDIQDGGDGSGDDVSRNGSEKEESCSTDENANGVNLTI
jgi:hypothetical protein